MSNVSALLVDTMSNSNRIANQLLYPKSH